MKSKLNGEEKKITIVTCEQFASALNLETIFEGIGEITICTDSVSRPGLPFAGFFEHFAEERVQVIGNAENNFLSCLPQQRKVEVLDRFFSKGIPCLIVARDLEIDDYIIEFAKKYDVPLFKSKKITTYLISQLNEYLFKSLAPTTILHGVMLDILGVGVLITGSAGIGKSETALELISKGHRIVADDSVEIRSLGSSLIAHSPQKIQYFMEVRGIGIINVKSMFGPAAVLPEKKIDLVIELVSWEKDTSYDRLGDEKQYTSILNNEVQKLIIPVSPGRNIPVIIETAARKARLEEFGYNAVDELVNIAFKK